MLILSSKSQPRIFNFTTTSSLSSSSNQQQSSSSSRFVWLWRRMVSVILSVQCDEYTKKFILHNKIHDRRLATSDDEDENPTPVSRRLRNDDEETQRTRKKLKLPEEEEEPEQDGGDDDDESKEDEDVQEDAKPIGEVVRLTGKDRGRREHFEAFGSTVLSTIW